MNNWAIIKGAALINSSKVAATAAANSFDLKLVALFHSTPFLLRKRRNNWEYERNANKRSSKKPYYYSRRYSKLDAKEELLRNVGAFTESLFQNGRFDDDFDDDYEPSSSRGSSSWFKRDSKSHNGPKAKAGGRRSFDFCDDEIDVETIFRSSFGGGSRFFYWSFIDEEEPRRSSSRGHYQNYRTFRNRKQNEDEYDYDSSEDSDSPEQDLTSDRLALGLSGSGPLSLEDVKNAYRACAMKWHPDRHAGSSKAVAEEKFKSCSAAYQSLCDKMALN